jgi:hypothetical protein
MYGLLNRAIKDLVESSFGQPAWDEVVAKVGPSALDFIAMKMYPDELTYELVQAVSEVSGLSSHAVMDAFGEHWISYTGHVGHGDLIAIMGDDVITFLRNLDSMHIRIMSMFPELEPPKFVVQDLGGGIYEMDYYSHRPALWPVVIGMVRGLGKLLDQNVTIELQMPKTESVGYDRFRIHILS